MPLLAHGLTCDGQGADGSVMVSATGLSFGSYDPASADAATSSVSVTAACTGDAPGATLPPLSLGISAGGSGDAQARSMAGPGTALAYQIYNAPDDATVWGDGTGGTATISGGDLGAASQDFTGYGVVPPHQFTTAGAYGDNLTVTVTY